MTEPRAQRNVAPTTPLPIVVRAPAFGPDDAYIVFARAILRREAAALRASKPKIEQSPTPDEIHELRVAARRLRVGLRLFAPMLPSRSAQRLRSEIRWFASSLGDVRDLDVYAESFKAYLQAVPPELRAGLGGFELYLRRERAEARQRAAAACASPRTAALLVELERFSATGPSAGALRRWQSLRVREAVKRGIRRSVARVRRLGEPLGERPVSSALHELRIKTKRLRYELEFFAEVYPHLKQTAKACKGLQDLLGTHQDAYTANARLRNYRALRRKQGSDGELPSALLDLRNRQIALARDVRKSFKEHWSAFAATIDAARRAVA